MAKGITNAESLAQGLLHPVDHGRGVVLMRSQQHRVRTIRQWHTQYPRGSSDIFVTLMHHLMRDCQK